MDIDWLRTICLSFPVTSEEIKWGNDLCFLVVDKMFCVTSLEPPFKVAFKVTDEEFDTTFQVNIYAYFRLCRAALRHMKAGAAIIGTSSGKITSSTFVSRISSSP